MCRRAGDVLPARLADEIPLRAVHAGNRFQERLAVAKDLQLDPARLDALMPLAARYNANIIALTLASEGLPTSADARI